MRTALVPLRKALRAGKKVDAICIVRKLERHSREPAGKAGPTTGAAKARAVLAQDDNSVAGTGAVGRGISLRRGLRGAAVGYHEAQGEHHQREDCENQQIRAQW